MIVVDTSALIAILAGEPEQASFNEKIAAADRCSLSIGTYLETHIVIGARYGEAGTRELTLFLHEAEIDLVPVDRDQADLARLAYMKYGRGRHPASLNYGDCFAYALAKVLNAPLLYTGDDFDKTDLLTA